MIEAKGLTEHKLMLPDTVWIYAILVFLENTRYVALEGHLFKHTATSARADRRELRLFSYQDIEIWISTSYVGVS